ncbi:MAG: alanine racemase [Acidimicrobiia bacterium]|nr:alanine racemase [Acidimicrobiia bacterium]
MGDVRPSFVEVDLDAIAHNVRQLVDLVAPVEVCAVVKADAYGHGDAPVAAAALHAGAGRLAVALVEEGIRLREADIDAPILVLSEPPVGAIAGMIRWGLTPTAYSPGFVDALTAMGVAGRVPVHVKVDTGMHRVGATAEVALALAKAIDASAHLQLEGVWTHLAVAEEDSVFTALQIERFEAFLSMLDDAGVPRPMAHVANTAGAFGGALYDMVRTGIGIYGLYPDPPSRGPVDLRPAMRIVSAVSHVQRLAAGERPSYGRRRSLPADAYVATVPIGYADGMPRRLSAVGGAVLIRGRRMPLAGTVTMDQIVVDAGDEPIEVGDEVVILGSQGEERISADEWAVALGTINYEVVCQIGPRLPRRYLP